MCEILEVEVLQNRHDFLSKHEYSLEGVFATAESEESFETAIQFFKDDEVVVLFLAAPMHVRDANATLHDLEDLALLQDGDVVFGRFGFVLFALHEEWF